MPKIIVTTSDKYLHLIPVFTYLFNKNWSSEQDVTILGYQAPHCVLPRNFTFVSMGKQGDVTEWSTDLRKYFEGMPDRWFIWLMEDTLLKKVDVPRIKIAFEEFFEIRAKVARVDLTNDLQKRPHDTYLHTVVSHSNANYRLSTQPSIWRKDFLLQYLTEGLTPWLFEKQSAINDGWMIIGFVQPLIKHNEGVRKHNPHELDLNGFPEEDVNHINKLLTNG